MSNLEVFFAEHRRLRACNAEMAAFARQLAGPATEILNDARWRFTRTLLRTLTMKDRLVFPRLRLHPDPTARETADRFATSTVADYERFANHTRRFPPEMASTDWRSYAAAVRMRTAEMDERMTREETELFPLLADAPEVDAGRNLTDINWAADGWRVRELLGIDKGGAEAA
ncbi:hemerythrin domain-containing protein [Sphingomonas sp.]|uniref:hemerythrin domain-containing protein n=1 Tax=Sphingomonas sp. TaxID=28214 RepID=UPI001EC29206|nr:hemerythrin domain-containing protein [Sphingomonas sp.]MBX3593012.1 hemerythrin domain-containing protein [Sphingomonas sp.]